MKLINELAIRIRFIDDELYNSTYILNNNILEELNKDLDGELDNLFFDLVIVLDEEI